MQLSEAKTALARKLNIDYATIASNDLFTDDDLADYIDAGIKLAWDFRPWTFTEKTYTTDAEGPHGALSYPNDFKDESILTLRAGASEPEAEEYRRLAFNDYKKEIRDNPDAKVWAETHRMYFANASSGYLYVTGTLRAPTLTTGTDKLPFSPDTDNQEDSGNRAIVLLAFGEALGSEKKREYAQAEVERKNALAILTNLWQATGARRSGDQPVRPLFDVPDFFSPTRF